MYGRDHPELAKYLGNAASVLGDQGDLAGALRAISDAFLIMFRSQGAIDRKVVELALAVKTLRGDPAKLSAEEFGSGASDALGKVLARQDPGSVAPILTRPSIQTQ